MHRWASSELALAFPKVESQVSEVCVSPPLDLKAKLDARPYPPLTGSSILQRTPPFPSRFRAGPDLVP